MKDKPLKLALILNTVVLGLLMFALVNITEPETTLTFDIEYEMELVEDFGCETLEFDCPEGEICPNYAEICFSSWKKV